MEELKATLYNTVGLIQIADVVDVLIMTFLLYYVFTLLRETSAGQVIKAIVFIIVFAQVTKWLNLYVTNFVFDLMIQIGGIALVVVFQPELRRLLTRLGSTRAKELLAIDRESGKSGFESYLAIILKATYDLSATQTGALMVFERSTSLGEIAATGTTVDDVMDRSGLPLIGVVPEDPQVTLAAAFGQPLLKHRKRARAAAAFRRIARRVQGLSVPIEL